MKLPAFLFAATILLAQPSSPPSVIYVTSDPAGACVASVQLRFNTSNGKLWGCNALTWGQIGGGGGSGTVSSATVGQLGYYTAATTIGGTDNWNYDSTNRTISTTLVDDPANSPTVALAGAGAGNVNDGAHCYAVSFCVIHPDQLADCSLWTTLTSISTDGGADVVVADHTTNGKVSLSSIPVSSDVRTGGRILYRSKAGKACADLNPGDMFILTQILNNTATTYTDNIADSGLATAPPYLDGANATGSITVNFSGGSVFSVGLSSTGWSLNNAFSQTPGIPIITSNGFIGYVTNTRAGALTNDESGNIGWQPNGPTLCTFATLGATLYGNGQSCYCSDCDVTSGSDNTCASGTGPAVAFKLGSVNKCTQ